MKILHTIALAHVIVYIQNKACGEKKYQNKYWI